MRSLPLPHPTKFAVESTRPVGPPAGAPHARFAVESTHSTVPFPNRPIPLFTGSFCARGDSIAGRFQPSPFPFGCFRNCDMFHWPPAALSPFLHPFISPYSYSKIIIVLKLKSQLTTCDHAERIRATRPISLALSSPVNRA